MEVEPVAMTQIDYDLLRLFAENEGKLLTHPAILRAIWGPAYGEESNYLHVYVSHLRRKIEPDAARPRYLLTQPGVGYRLVVPAAAYDLLQAFRAVFGVASDVRDYGRKMATASTSASA